MRPCLAQLATVGVGPGKSPEGAGLAPDALAALYDGVAHEAASLPTATRLSILNQARQTSGWYLPAPNIGRYGTDYLFRAQVAVFGIGANTPNEAIYPTGIVDAAGALYDGAHRYRLTFPPGQQPPAKYFWSVTMYDTAGYLVENPIGRYSVGPSHPPLARATRRLDRDRDPARPAERGRRQLAPRADRSIPAQPQALWTERCRADRGMAPARSGPGGLAPIRRLRASPRPRGPRRGD